ncbi:uncharacterized protein isoform X2 [Rhodnius prolixus]
MNEHDRPEWYLANLQDAYQSSVYGRLYEIPYWNQAWPLPYRYLTSDIYGNVNHPKEFVKKKVVPGQGNDHKHYLEELPDGLTYVVTEHINYGSSNVMPHNPMKKPVTKPETIHCPTKKAAHIQITTPALQVENYNKEKQINDVNGKEIQQSVNVKPVEETSRANILEEGPDVMMNDGERVTHSRAVWKREIKPAVPVDVLFDGILMNLTETESNVSQFLTNLFEDLDETALLDLIKTLKEEYLSTATAEESKIIEDTFSKLVASLSIRRKPQKKKEVDGKVAEEKLKSDLIAEAASVLELLAEETSFKDTSEGFFDDESYQDYYSNLSQESSVEETSEPSFMELLSLATKHKASKGILNDKKA